MKSEKIKSAFFEYLMTHPTKTKECFKRHSFGRDKSKLYERKNKLLAWGMKDDDFWSFKITANGWFYRLPETRLSSFSGKYLLSWREFPTLSVLVKTKKFDSVEYVCICDSKFNKGKLQFNISVSLGECVFWLFAYVPEIEIEKVEGDLLKIDWSKFIDKRFLKIFKR